MPDFKFNSSISLGNILTILGMIVAVAAGYQQLAAQSQFIEQRISQGEAERAAIEERLRVLENSSARADERFTAVLQVLGRIEARLERIEGRP